jgi:hypothetical protein
MPPVLKLSLPSANLKRVGSSISLEIGWEGAFDDKPTSAGRMETHTLPPTIDHEPNLEPLISSQRSDKAGDSADFCRSMTSERAL